MNILITGGTGTFGHALVARLLSNHAAERIVVYSRDEQKQEQMARTFDHPALRFFIGDVRDQQRLAMAMRDIDTVYHAAALKIVPTAEYNPFEAVMTNIHGAENVIRAAMERGVQKVIALSTDKAVSPVNLYGATKLCAEKIFIAANNLGGEGGCHFSVVRYGNVVGSRGSVVPLFRSQIAAGIPITVTDPAMTRFWITIEQAVDFVLKGVRLARGREIFVPVLPSVKIMDIVAAMVPHKDYKINVTGIRPGEKLHETLVSMEETCYMKSLSGLFVIQPHTPPKAPMCASYSSGTNKQWMTVEQIRESIEPKTS